jgi:serine/threonine protein phosphatase PrpC
MEKNLQKAAEEHAAPCALQPTALPAAQPIALRAAGASAQGIRERMEDEQGVCQMDDRWTAAYVIDGHSSDGRGRQLARLAACYLMRHLSRYLQHHHPFTALERAIDESGAQIDRCRDLSHSGCTVLITLIDHDTGSVYTATVGDSEAVVVRGEEWIPLSVVRDWGSPKDHARAQEVFRRTCGYSWSGDPGAEKPRFPGEGYGLNVSRALGDAARLAPVSCKPKITAYQLRPDDLVVLACDGLWDYLPSFGEIVPLVRQSSSPQQLVEAALHRYRSEDNVSVLILTVLNR